MRDEDLKNLPQSIERWRFGRMLEELGFGKDAQNNLRGFVVGAQGIKAVLYATDENGKKYAVRQMDHVPVQDLADKDPQMVPGSFSAEIATHEISIPFAGSWEKPDGLVDGITRCQSQPVGEYAALQCERQPGHGGQHVAWNSENSDVRWGSNSPTLCGVEHEIDYVKCDLLEGHDGRHAGTGEDGGAYVWEDPCPHTHWLGQVRLRCEGKPRHADLHGAHMDGVLHKW